MATASGRQALLERYRREPQAGAQALFLEFVARSLNDRQTLITGGSAAALVDAAGLTEVQERYQALLADQPHALYEVRRLTRRSSKRPHGRGITARSVRAVAHGSREQMTSQLAAQPGERHAGPDGITRHVLRARGAELPSLEHFYVVCPAVVEDKARPGFEQWWQEAASDDVLF